MYLDNVVALNLHWHSNKSIRIYNITELNGVRVFNIINNLTSKEVTRTDKN